ncbi:MAG: hypothetical protein ACHQVS_00845 [Candidatus Babeliales bacterium]
MVISRLLNLAILLGSLLGAVPTYAMGGRLAYAPKSRLAALALGSGGLWSYFSGKQKQQQSQFSRFPASVTSPYAHLDLNPRGLFHSLPKPKVVPLSIPAPAIDEGAPLFDVLSLTLMPAMAAWGSYDATPVCIYEKIRRYDSFLASKKDNNAPRFTKEEIKQLTVDVPEPEVEKIAEQNAIQTGVRAATIGALSVGLSKGIEFATGVDTESVEEIGEFVTTTMEKDSLSDDERKEFNMPSTVKLVFKLGLVWLAFQGLKKLFTYTTGYQCQCPALPSSIVGTGKFSKVLKSFIEGATRMSVKAAIASSVVMPLLSMKETNTAPVSDVRIESMLHKKLEDKSIKEKDRNELLKQFREFKKQQDKEKEEVEMAVPA